MIQQNEWFIIVNIPTANEYDNIVLNYLLILLKREVFFLPFNMEIKFIFKKIKHSNLKV